MALSPQQWAESELSQPSLKEGRGHRPRVLRLPYHSLPSLMGLPLHSSSRGSKPDPQEAWLRAESSGTCWQLQKVQVSSAVPRDSTITQTTTRTPRAEHREGTLSWGICLGTPVAITHGGYPILQWVEMLLMTTQRTSQVHVHSTKMA